MPIIVPKDIPASKILQAENVFIMNEKRASTQDIRPLEIAVINLMPTKIVTETQLYRLLSNTPLQVNVTLITTKTYVGKNTPIEHLQKFYKSFDDIKSKKYDGMIVTGAPVEDIEFKDVKYWDELKEIFEFAKTNVTSTMFICWGAISAMYYYYGIKKRTLKQKLFGVYEHEKVENYERLLKGMDDVFYMPHSRKATVSEKDVKECKDLILLAKSKKAGATIIRSKDDKFFFITGHAEYDRDTLKLEYERDKEKGIEIAPPENYFKKGNSGEIKMTWLSTANLIYSNWLNHYVYQITPYDIERI